MGVSTTNNPDPSFPNLIMPPLASPIYQHLSSRVSLSPIELQWHNPATILAVLSVIGGDIIHRATAQLAGNPYYFAPVTLSFGWTGFLLTFILSLIGDGSALPRPDCNCTVVDVTTHATTQNKSWVLGRLVRDNTTHITKGLNITFYVTKPGKQGISSLDWVHYWGIVVMLVQLTISIVPGALYKDWNILVVTVWGLFLGIAFGALPHWTKEKWSCSKEGGLSEICLVRGKDVMVIYSKGIGYIGLMKLANAEGVPLTRGTIIFSAMLCLLQLGRLLTVAGLHDHAWFSLAIACIGTVYNYVAAGVRRDFATTGIYLEQDGPPISGEDILDVLKQLTKAKRQHVGIALLPVVVPGKLPKDIKEWKYDTARAYDATTNLRHNGWSASTTTLARGINDKEGSLSQS